MPTINLGRVRPVHKGTFDSTLTYTIMDRVIYEGNVYECVADAPAGTNPAAESSAYWMPLGISGDNGLTPEPVWDGTKLHFEYPDGTETAEVNLQGPQGIQGPQGPAGQTPPITSDLTSTAEDVALSAKAGKTLKDSVDGVQNAANNAASAAAAAQSTADAAAAAAATAATTTALGRARLATPAEVQAGAAAAGSPAPAVLRPEDIAAFPAALGGAMLYNTREVLTTSGSWTAPVTGWVRMLLIGGGGGSGGSIDTNPGYSCGGGAGEELELFLFLDAGTSYSSTVGAGGTAGGVSTDGGNGGDTSITVNGVTYTSHGGHAGRHGNHGAGQGGGAGLSAGQSGTTGCVYTGNANAAGGAGGGRGGGVWSVDAGGHIPPTGYGAGASGAGTLSNTPQAGSAGMQGCIVIDYFDPSKVA